MNTIRILLSTMLAIALGALSGAALLGLPPYFSKECGFLGCDRQWAPYFAMWGALFGVVPGGCIGLVVSGLKLDATRGGLVGGGVGFFLVFAFLVKNNFQVSAPPEVLLIVAAFIPICAIIGLTITFINRRPRLA